MTPWGILLPHLEAGIDARGGGALDKSPGVIEKHFVNPHVRTDTPQTAKAPVEQRGNVGASFPVT